AKAAAQRPRRRDGSEVRGGDEMAEMMEGVAAVENGGEAEELRLRELLDLCGRYCFQRSLAFRLHPGCDGTRPPSVVLASDAAAVAAGAFATSVKADTMTATVPDQGQRMAIAPMSPIAPGLPAGGEGLAATQPTEAAAAAATATVDELLELMIDDARKALLFAVRSYKGGKEQHHYHPARYVLARCEVLLGRPE
ncbi:hypothetical protein Vretimale_16753, partial [Volvox reticuliferus]